MQARAEMTTLFTILGMALVTSLPRILPLLLLSVERIPAWVRTWLEYIPVAVLAAMLLPSLLVSEGSLNVSGSNLYLWAALPCFVVAWRTRSLLWTVASGLLIVMAVRLIGG